MCKNQLPRCKTNNCLNPDLCLTKFKPYPMKNPKIFTVLTILCLSILPGQLTAGSNPASTTPITTESVQAQKLLTRLDELKAMDKSAMNTTEKLEMRKEVRSINKELKTLGGGVYLSVGAIIIILLLLIIIL